MADDNNQNDNLQNTAEAYEGLDPAAFEEPEQLTDDQVADVLMRDAYGDELYGDEEYGDSEYGGEYESPIEAVPGAADDVADYKQKLATVQEENPHILSPAAVKELEPILTRIAADHSWDAAANPEVLAMAYQRIGARRGSLASMRMPLSWTAS